MASTGLIYSYDASQNVTFPATVKATSGFTGNLTGTATTATKLGSSTVGSAIKPIYLSSGAATACSYELNKTVPSDAKFTDTTYSAGTGLSLSGTTFNHSNSVTAATASEGGSARTLAFGGTFNVPSVSYDSQGHITGKGSVTLTMPANPAPTDYISTGSTAQSKSGNLTLTGLTRLQNGSAASGIVIGADVSATTLTNGTRTLGRMSFPSKEDKSFNVSFVSCDTDSGGNGAEFGGRTGDATNTSPDYISFTVANTHNLTGSNKTLIAEYLKDKVMLFPRSGSTYGTGLNPHGTNYTEGRWTFYNGNTFTNSGITYTLPSSAGTLATTADIASAIGEAISNSY